MFWTALAAIAAVSAAILVYFQIRMSRFSLSVDVVLRTMDVTFNGREFLGVRSKAATALSQIKSRHYAEDRILEAKVEPVLDFFETIGMLVRRKALDKEIVHSTFFYWYYGYWLNSKDLIERQRKKFPARYGDFLDLRDRLLIYEDGPVNEEEWARFLEEETAEGETT